MLKERDINLSNEEKRQEKERQTLEVAFEKMSEEKLKLQDFAKRIQEKSKLVEKLSKVTKIFCVEFNGESFVEVTFWMFLCSS